MTQADKNFIEICKEILKNGYSSKGTNVRTKWEDGTEANYISIVGVSNKYDVEKEFPMITLRNNTNTIKKAIDEILWIWQKNPTKNFYEFKVEDFEIQGYDYNKEVKIGKIPVAE